MADIENGENLGSVRAKINQMRAELDAAPSPSADAFLRGSGDGTTFENLTAAQVRTALNVEAFATVSDFFAAVDAGYTAPNGTVVSAGPVQFQADSSANVTGLRAGWVPFGDVTPEHFGASGDGVTNDSTAIQNAIDYLAGISSPRQGGTVHFGPTVYVGGGIVYKPYVTLRGAGRFATIILAPDGLNDDVLIVPDASAGNGLFDLTVDGNRINQTAGNGLYFEDTLSSTGDANLAAKRKADGVPDSENAYKWFLGSNFITTNCKQSGIYNDGYGFAVRLFGFETTFNDEHGLWAAGTDCEYALAYVEKNGKSGIYCSTGAQKFSDIKIHWSNRRRSTHLERWAGFHCVSGSGGALSSIQTTNIEAQSNYGDGFYIRAEKSSFLGLAGDRNGYLSLGNENVSDEESSHFVFDGCDDISVIAHTRDNGSTVDDGLWVTQWPYREVEASSFSVFNITSDGNVNAPAPLARMQFQDDDLGGIVAQRSAGGQGFLDINSAAGAGDNANVRLFRDTAVSGGGRALFSIHSPGSYTIRHQISGDGLTQFNVNDDGDLSIGSGGSGGAWDTSHLRLGPYHLWVDATGDLRIKGSAPTSDTDGTVVGSQS